MPIQEALKTDMIAAMKAKDADKLVTIRMAIAAIKNKEVEKRAALDDGACLGVLTTMVKQRKDSVEQFTKGNRPDLAEKEEKEILILARYMPQEVDADQLKKLIADKIEATRHLSSPQMGLVMRAVQAELAERNLRADGKLVSTLVKEALG